MLARALPVEPIDEDALSTFSIDGTLEEVGRCFGAGLKRSPFLDAGLALGHLVRCCTPTPDYHGPVATLGSVLLDERLVPKRFFIDRNKLPSWRYLKGAKRLNRTRPDGSGYVYTEGAVAFPDAANRSSRTLLTSEGSSSASRTTHVVKCGNRRHRRLTPVELERLNGFPDEWTKLRGEGVENSDVRRGFLMGNALVVGLVERIGEVLAADWKAHVAAAPAAPTAPTPLTQRRPGAGRAVWKPTTRSRRGGLPDELTHHHRASPRRRPETIVNRGPSTTRRTKPSGCADRAPPREQETRDEEDDGNTGAEERHHPGAEGCPGDSPLPAMRGTGSECRPRGPIPGGNLPPG